MRNRDTERQRHGDSDDTEETEDVPALAACVKTLQEAVQLSLVAGLDEKCLFTFARALKAFEITTNRRLPQAELPAVFMLWWSSAKPLLSPDEEFDEWRFDFEDTFAKTKSALGANSLEEAVRRADSNPLPPQAERYTSLKLKRLVAICYHLQLLQGRSPFWLGARAAARILVTKNLLQANARLTGLVRDGLLTVVEKGTRKRSTRFRFNLPEFTPSGETQTAAPTRGARCDASVPPPPAVVSKSASPSAPHKLSTYQLVERKKALQELVKALPHQDYMDSDDRKRYKKLKKELATVTSILAGVSE